MRKTYLGEFEEVVLLTVALLYDEAYGVGITEEIERQTGRSPSISAVHATLHRLQDKGFVNFRMGGLRPSGVDGGKDSLLSLLPGAGHCMRFRR